MSADQAERSRRSAEVAGDQAVALHRGRLHAVVGSSWYLRQQALDRLLAAWEGPVKRLARIENVEDLLVGLDTPSFLEPAALNLLSPDEAWLSRHGKTLATQAGQPVTAGILVLSCARLPRNESLGKSLAKAGCLIDVAPPGTKEIQAWLIAWLVEQAHPVDSPRAVAEALIAHRGEDLDGLLAAFEQAVCYAGDEAVGPATIATVVGGDVAGPVWAFTGALLQARVAQALRAYHAGAGMEPHAVLGALASELRKTLAALSTDDDAAAARLAGLRGRANLYYPRQRGRELGRRTIERLLVGVVQAQRKLRTTGLDSDLVLETLVLNAQQVIRGGGLASAPTRGPRASAGWRGGARAR